MKRITMLALGVTVALGGTTAALACDGPEKSAERAQAKAQAIAAADANGDGALSPEEFVVFTETIRQQRANHMFSKLDTDGDGQISAAELENAPHRHHRGGPQG